MWMCPSGKREWFRNGKLHREGDQPAVIFASGTLEWYTKGLLHRGGDHPARIRADGTQVWFINGELHRDGDQPAVMVILIVTTTSRLLFGPMERKSSWTGRLFIRTEQHWGSGVIKGIQSL